MSYERTLTRVETYFDRTAMENWARLTSDAPVSWVRETVRRGRDAMRAELLSRLPDDLTDARVLDAGCGAGQMTHELAQRGAQVVAVDISPSLVGLAEARLPTGLRGNVEFRTGDMLDETLGEFDHTVAMDSLIYYPAEDIAKAIDCLQARTKGCVAFTLAPRTPLLMAMWHFGQFFPRDDRSPTMIPQSPSVLQRALADRSVPGVLTTLRRIGSGFYISQAMEFKS